MTNAILTGMFNLAVFRYKSVQKFVGVGPKMIRIVIVVIITERSSAVTCASCQLWFIYLHAKEVTAAVAGTIT